VDPYRTSGKPEPVTPSSDRDLLGVFALLWFVCMLRVGAAFARHETWGAGATVCAMIVAILSVQFARRFNRS